MRMLKLLTTIGVGVMAGMVSHPILRQMTGWPPSADSFSILIAIVTMGAIGSAFVLANSGKADDDAPGASPDDVVASSVAESVATVTVEEPKHVSRLSDPASTKPGFIDVEYEHFSSLRRAPLRILDRHGELAYEGSQERGSAMSARICTARGDVVATVHQHWLSAGTWYVKLDGKPFEIRRERFSLKSRNEVVGGPWHLATARGNISSCTTLEIEHRGRLLARASGFLVAGRHRVEMPTNRNGDERFIVAILLALRMQSDSNFERD
jgi:hypothetical protein